MRPTERTARASASRYRLATRGMSCRGLRAALALSAVLLVAAALGGPAAGASTARHCGSVRGGIVKDLRALRLRCSTAAGVATRAVTAIDKRGRGFGVALSVAGYSCVDQKLVQSKKFRPLYVTVSCGSGSSGLTFRLTVT